VHAPAREDPEHEREQARQERDDQRLDLQETHVADNKRLARRAQVKLADVGLRKRAAGRSADGGGAGAVGGLLTEVEKRAPSVISRLPLRLSRIGVRMKSSSTRMNTGHVCVRKRVSVQERVGLWWCASERCGKE